VARVIRQPEDEVVWPSETQSSILGRVSKTKHVSADPAGPEIASNATRTAGTMRFRLLGPLEVDAGGGPLPLGGPKQRAVLAHLLIRANEVVPAETLMDEIWGEEPPDTVRKVIQTYVSNLRKVIGHERIEGRTPGYRLRVDPSELDATRFETLVREARKALLSDPRAAVGSFDDALALWRGPALAGVVGDQPSLLAQAARLNEARIEVQEGRVEAMLASGADSRAVGELEILVAEHPLRESLWGQLMLALYRQGRQADALAAYQRAREILADELGIDPSPELSRLHERILHQDPSLDAREEPLRGYRLMEKIDEGATGIVFRAIQPQIARDVAIKIFHEHLASDPSFVRRFEHDAQAIAALEHPHIVPIYDYWREPGRAYVVSRYMRTGSLRALVQRGETLVPERAISLVEQIASALTFAHRQGVAHGDVRLSNMFTDADENAYLGDFIIGVNSGRDPGRDVQDLIGVARELFAGAMPVHLAELAERADSGTDIPTADEIVAAINRSGEPAVGSPVRGDERNPYKGLRPFTEADAADFFGRNHLVRRLVSRLGEPLPGARFLAVVGPSGGGKSSVVRAGLVPAVRRGAMGGDEHDRYVAEMFPGPHPIEELEAALLRVAVGPLPRLRDGLESGSRGLLDAVDRALPLQAQLLLVIDQFEEAFTLTADESERELFLESLRVAAADPDSRVRVVVTLRADFYDRPLVYPRFGELLAQRNEAVPPLAPDELEKAIRAPAEGVGVAVESGLVAEMVADVAHQPGALPLLQYALTELFERRDGNRLTLGTYEEIGGVAGALSARAERIYASTAAEGRRAIKQVFLRLITLGEGREDTRRRVTRSELDQLDVGQRAVDAVLDTFGRHRLLTFDREPVTREPTVEIAHEALLGGWDRFRRWIDDGREDLRQNRRLEQAGAEWRGSSRDPSFLLQGTRLEQVEEWADTTEFAIANADRSFLKASIERRDDEVAEESARLEHEAEVDRRSIRRLRSLVAVGVAAALVATTLTVVAVGQRRRAESASGIARDASTAQLAQRLGAQALVEEDLSLSLLLARQAVAIDDSPQTRSYLFAALLDAPQVAGMMHAPSSWSDFVRSIAVSPDGSTLAVGVAEVDGGLLFFDALTYEQIGDPLPVRHAVESVAFSPDGRTVAFGGQGYIRLIDARTREQLAAARVASTDTGANRISFTPDGSRLVVVIQSNTARDRISVRDAATLAPTGRALAPEGFQGAYVGSTWQAPGFALTPDGHSAVIATTDPDELVWLDLRSGASTRRLTIEDGRHPLALSPDGRTAAVGVDGGFELINIGSRAKRMVPGARGGTPSWLLFSGDGETVVSTSLDGTVALWDLPAATLRETLLGHSGAVMQPAFGPDGTLYTVSHDGTAIAWDLAGERGFERPFVFTHDPSPDIDYSGHTGRFSPDGKLIAVGLQGRGIQLWDTTTMRAFGPPLRETGGEVKDQVFSADGSTLAATSLDTVTVWDVENRSLRAGPFRSEFFVGISADGSLLATVDGAFLGTVAGSSVRLRDVATGEPIGTIPDAARTEVGSIAFSPAGSTLAVVHWKGGTVELWDATGPSLVTTLPVERGKDGYGTIAFSPDGRYLATGNWHGKVLVWDLGNDMLVRELDVGEAGAFAVDFSPDGEVLAVGGWEPVATLWDVATGAQIGSSLRAGNGRASIDLSSDGGRLLLTHADGRGAIYDVDPESWAQRACTVANRTVTPEEWKEFLPGRPYDPACAS
jgi:WD40 repeat protein/DNA-binding SARP family transcriptional activator